MKKWVKMASLGLLLFSVLGACGKVQDTKDSKEVQSSTVESTTHTKEKESIIQSKTATDYDTIYVQNELVIGQTGDDSSYNWTIYDTSLKEKNSILNADKKRDELAHSLKTGYSKKVNGTAVIENNVNEYEIYSTYLDENAELAKTSLGERTVDNDVSINTLTSGKYEIIPYRDWSGVTINYLANGYREKRFSTAHGSMSGDINKNGHFTLLDQMNDSKTVNDTSVQIYDAKLKDSGDSRSGEKDIATKTINTVKLDTATNINDKNRLFIRQYTSGLVDDPAIWTFYDLDSGTSYNYPSNIEIVKFVDYGIETPIGDGEFLGDIGEAENYVFEDLNEKVTPDGSTPSSIDFTSRKKGIISSDGTVIKEPFAFEIKKPNINGIAPYKLEKEDKYGLINVNTGEIIKEPFAYNIQQYNDNGLSAMTESEDGKYSIIDEKGNILEETEYIYISPLTNDNLASCREKANESLGVLKVNG
ncbi:TPA: hypothetical protein I0G61_RS03335 [Enterococcus faecalis]|uniref:hypothetical protein n=2 Tax=Enterococcus faecalis TaxID=1351 RepID=UPI000452D990|nr:hypothetical protein [Enterococcus faecalis]ETT94113.1 hypothetical protein P000_00522 [Enterococcus faecalis EnGen0400]MCV3152851.1 hypothetical protein [Enterococcus faecalis]NSU59964.1 hypothetical protein [Enterococcus faecalis]NSU78208.1 hypothetical protein [Enterococcus faecalis]NSU98452.1 hypothetical protein [Enterococcus faecalis]